jgi:hypothetical protein
VVAHFLHTEGVTGSNPVSPIYVVDYHIIGRHSQINVAYPMT